MKKIILILSLCAIFYSGVASAAAPKITSIVTNDQAVITVVCSECIKATPGVIRVTNKSGGAKQTQNFTDLSKTKSLSFTFKSLQLGKTFDIEVWSTGTEAAGNAYLYTSNGNGKTNAPIVTFKTPLNQVGSGGTSTNQTPLKIDVVKNGTEAVVSITCSEQCNGLKGEFILSGSGYTSQKTNLSFVTNQPAKHTFTGLTPSSTYTLNGTPALPDGTIYKFPAYTFTMDGVNQGPQTVQSDIPTDIIPQKNNTGSELTYTLLAPIGDLTKVDTNSIGDYLNTIFKIAIGLCGALAVIMIVIGGVQYMGDESVFGKTEAKSKITSAILGLFIALGAFALLNTINPDLTGKNGVTVDQVSATISPEDTATGSETVSPTGASLCVSATNPPDPNKATGSTLNLNSIIKSEYVPARDSLPVSTGVKLLVTAQTGAEGFKQGTKSYGTHNPGNIGNVDNAVKPWSCGPPSTKGTRCYDSLAAGIQAQVNILKNISNNSSPSYKIGSKPTCALGSETYSGYLYQYLRIYSTEARFSNEYLNIIIGYFKANGKNITGKTTISEIYNMK